MTLNGTIKKGENKMKKFWIDFSGYCSIEAETREEAEEKFWQGLQTPSKDAFDDVYDIEGIEEME